MEHLYTMKFSPTLRAGIKLQLSSRRNEFHLQSDGPDSWMKHSGVNEALCTRASAALKWILLWPNKNHRLEIVMIQKFSARNRSSCKIFGNCRKRLMVSLCRGEESWPLVFMVLVPVNDNFRRRWLSPCGLSSKIAKRITSDLAWSFLYWFIFPLCYWNLQENGCRDRLCSQSCV